MAADKGVFVCKPSAIKFLVKQGKTPDANLEEMSPAYGRILPKKNVIGGKIFSNKAKFLWETILDLGVTWSLPLEGILKKSKVELARCLFEEPLKPFCTQMANKKALTSLGTSKSFFARKVIYNFTASWDKPTHCS